MKRIIVNTCDVCLKDCTKDEGHLGFNGRIFLCEGCIDVFIELLRKGEVVCRPPRRIDGRWY